MAGIPQRTRIPVEPARIVLAFFLADDSSQPITRLGARSRWNQTIGKSIQGEGRAKRNAAPGGFDGGHPCRASRALRLLSPLRCRVPPLWRTIHGSTVAVLKTPAANGVAATMIAKVIQRPHRQRPGGSSTANSYHLMKPCLYRRPMAG